MKEPIGGVIRFVSGDPGAWVRRFGGEENRQKTSGRPLEREASFSTDEKIAVETVFRYPPLIVFFSVPEKTDADVIRISCRP